MKKINNFLVWAILYYLRFFARLSLFLSKPKIIGITGSVGKSSARNSIHAAIKDYFKVKVIKEGNSETGIPLGILGIDPGHYTPLDWLRILLLSPFKIANLKGIKYLIVEMGIDSPFPPKNMSYLLTIVKPDVSLVLNVHPVHTQQFDSLFQEKNSQKKLQLILERIAQEKSKIITEARPAVGIYNMDDPNIKKEISKFKGNVDMLTFGDDKKSDFTMVDYKITIKKTEFTFLDRKENKKVDLKISNFALPKSYSEVFAATFLIGKTLGLTYREIGLGLEKNFTMPSSRGTIFQGINNSVIIDSSYNASKASVFNFLDLASDLSIKENRPLFFLFGDMRELGHEAEIEHMEAAEKIIEKKVHQVFLVGKITKKVVLPALTKKLEKVLWFDTSLAAGKYLKEHLPHRAIILVKGSQNEIFLEEAIKKILKNKKDFKNLCRQNSFWLSKKASFFRGYN